MTRDLRPAWLNVARRLQGAACREQSGHFILTIKVLADESGDPVRIDGEPVIWTKPQVLRLEPKNARVAEILEALT
jgi:hypothetical protein